MIEKTQAFKVGERYFPCIVDAQKHELAELLEQAKVNPDQAEVAAAAVMEHQEEVLDILTMKPTSRPTARKIHGAVKKKRTKKNGDKAPEKPAEKPESDSKVDRPW